MLSKLQSAHLCCLVLTIATPYLQVFLSILLRGFKESKMQQPDQYLEHPDLSTSHHSSRFFWLPVNRRTLHKVVILSTPNVKLKSYGQCSFAYHGPSTWNSLPLALRYQQESDCFKRAFYFFYFHLPTINTTLVITNLTHLTYY